MPPSLWVLSVTLDTNLAAVSYWYLQPRYRRRQSIFFVGNSASRLGGASAQHLAPDPRRAHSHHPFPHCLLSSLSVIAHRYWRGLHFLSFFLSFFLSLVISIASWIFPSAPTLHLRTTYMFLSLVMLHPHFTSKSKDARKLVHDENFIIYKTLSKRCYTTHPSSVWKRIVDTRDGAWGAKNWCMERCTKTVLVSLTVVTPIVGFVGDRFLKDRRTHLFRNRNKSLVYTSASERPDSALHSTSYGTFWKMSWKFCSVRYYNNDMTK